MNSHKDEFNINIDNKLNNYNRDKSGWVSFNNGKKKEKLRTWISKKAKWLTKWNTQSFFVNRQFLINHYNNNGLKGVSNIFNAEAMNLINEFKEKNINEQQKADNVND